MAGPWIWISAAVFTDHVTVDPLTDIIPLWPTVDYKHLERISRLFQSLKLAISELENFYQSNPSLIRSQSHQNFFPYQNSFLGNNNEKFEIQYEEWLKKSICLAKIKDGTQKLVVKITDKYNETAHNLCTSKGLAPKLFSIDKDTIYGWTIVVMEFLEAEQLQSAVYSLSEKECNTIWDEIQSAVKTLHDNNIVFGDLRPNNILVYTKNGEKHASLIDFDWSGVAGTDQYPYFMNHENITWPAGVEDGKVLDKEHDNEWLERLKNIIFPQQI